METYTSTDTQYEEMFKLLDKREKIRVIVSLLLAILLTVVCGQWLISPFVATSGDDEAMANLIFSVIMYLVFFLAFSTVIYGGNRFEREVQFKTFARHSTLVGTSVYGWFLVGMLKLAKSIVYIGIGAAAYGSRITYYLICTFSHKPILKKNRYTYEELVQFGQCNGWGTTILLTIGAFALLKGYWDSKHIMDEIVDNKGPFLAIFSVVMLAIGIVKKVLAIGRKRK